MLDPFNDIQRTNYLVWGDAKISTFFKTIHFLQDSFPLEEVLRAAAWHRTFFLWKTCHGLLCGPLPDHCAATDTMPWASLVFTFCAMELSAMALVELLRSAIIGLWAVVELDPCIWCTWLWPTHSPLSYFEIGWPSAMGSSLSWHLLGFLLT